MATARSRAVRFHRIGEPLDVLAEENVEVPDPLAGNVRVRVLAVGLNPADWELCRGFLPGSLPRGIGCDVAGVVDAVGEGADRSVGDVVFGTADFAAQPSAGAADFAILNNYFGVPAGLDPVRAAILPMVVQTAAWTLQLMNLEPGDTLLVHGAGGMVGYAAVQIAVRSGAQVIATAGPTLAGQLEAFGARVTRYGEGMPARVRELTGGGDVDLVLDAPRPSPGTLPDLIGLAGDPSRVVTISNHQEARELGARVNIDELTGELASRLVPLSVLLPEYASLAARGAFRLPIAKVYPLARWRDGVELSLSGNPHGKVVLVPDGSSDAADGAA